MGALLTMMCGPFFPVHQTRGGSHALTHALVKAATAYGAKILPCCPVKKIILKNGEAKAVQLSEHAVFPSETISAKKIISNCTLIPTFKYMVGYDNIDSDRAAKIDKFDYNEQNLFATYWALDGAPQFASAQYDDGIQRCYMGYFGGKDTEALLKFNQDLVSRVIHPEIRANWFIPTLTDPTQAPEGGHTAFVWLDAPPQPKSWKHGSLNGLPAWDDIKNKMADQVVETFEKYAPGFKKLIKDQIIYTPYDMQRNNPSAVLGNWLGGSVIPSQWYMNRPVRGVLEGGGSRTFVKNLYLSNSIHLFSYTGLSSGYIAAGEVAEDLGVREQEWWCDKALNWYLDNINNIPQNLGVR
jgi:beta-carotene ketolase (CrtO type)